MANEKGWTTEEAEIAYKAEQELTKNVHKSTLYVRFPDPPLNSDIIKAYSDDIESVYFQNPICERYCFVHLKDSVDVDKVIQTLSNVRFGDGFLKVELRELQIPKEQNTIDTIDPYTLYCGNLAQTIPCKKLKEYFPKASRIDVGFAQRMKNTRYAFVRYKSVNDAVEAFKRMVNCEIEGRTIILRFRRVPKHNNVEREEEEHTEDCSMINTSMVASEQIDAGETLLNESFSSNQIVSAGESDLESSSNLQQTVNVMEDETVDNEAPKDNENNLESYQIEDNVAETTGNNILSTQNANDCQKAKDGFVNTSIEVETNVLVESNVFITTDENQINKEDAHVHNETNNLEHYRKEQNETEPSGNNVLDKQIDNATQQVKDIFGNTEVEELNEPETFGNNILDKQIENANQQAKDIIANTTIEEVNDPEIFGNNILDKRIENATKKPKGVFANTAVDVESNGSESMPLITSTDKEANKSDNNLSDASAEKENINLDNATLNAPIDNEVIPQMSTTQVENQTDLETNILKNIKVVIKNSNTVVTDKSISGMLNFD